MRRGRVHVPALTVIAPALACGVPRNCGIAALASVLENSAVVPDRNFCSSGGIHYASLCRVCGDNSSRAVSASACGRAHRDSAC